MQEPVTIVRLERLQDFRKCELLQQVIWGAEPIEVTPADVLITFHRHGGLVLGAFDDAQRMIGFVFGFPGMASRDNPLAGEARQLHHCSHALGVIPEWQGKGVGFRLKLAQREWLASQGMDLVTWTYDPLEAANAILNIGKLGAVCRCYLRDLYGTMPDVLNAGMASDRLEVAWWIRSARVIGRVKEGWRQPAVSDLQADGVPIVHAATLRSDGLIAPGDVVPSTNARLLVEFPSDIQAIKRTDGALAVSWRMSLREIVEPLFARGHGIVDIAADAVGSVRRVYYLLEYSAVSHPG